MRRGNAYEKESISAADMEDGDICGGESLASADLKTEADVIKSEEEEEDDCMSEENDCLSEVEDDCVSERTDVSDDGDILSVEAEDVIRDNANVFDELTVKLASAIPKTERYRLQKEALSYLREEFVSRLLSAADMRARWDNDEYFDNWYERAQNLKAKDPNLDLNTAMRIVLKRHKAVLNKHLRDAIENVKESGLESETDDD